MRLGKLTVQNFLSVRYAEVELEKQGLVMVQGKNNDDPAFESNGAGKSAALFDSLTTVLFDKTMRGLTGDEIVNNKVGSNCALTLDFWDNAGVPMRITRYRKHKEHKNNCHIFKNGKNITPKSTKDANKLIEEIFQLDFHTFTNSIIFGQGLVKMFSTATDKEKKEILEKMLQMEQYQKLQEKAKEKLSDANQKLSNVDSEASKTTALIEEISGSLVKLRAAEEEEAAKAREEVKELEVGLKKAKLTLHKHIEESTDYSEQVTALTKLKDSVDKKLAEYNEAEQLLVSQRGEVNSLERDIVKLSKNYDSLKVDLELTAMGQSSTCSACGQEIKADPESIKQAVDHISKKMRETKLEQRNVAVALSELTSRMEETEKLVSGKNKLEQQKQTILGELSQVQASIKSEANLRSTYEDAVERIEASIGRAKKRATTTYKALIEQTTVELESHKEKLNVLAAEAEALKVRIAKLKFWVEGFGNAGIKSHLLDAVTPFLNTRANYYLSKLAGGTMEIKFSTQTRLASGELRDKFEVQILNSVGGESYEANSTGERRRIDLSISLALQDLVKKRASGRLNILLYDEMFDGLDAVGCENAIQLLHEMEQSVETIYVITHNDVLKAFFDKTLVVTKEDGATRVHKE